MADDGVKCEFCAVRPATRSDPPVCEQCYVLAFLHLEVLRDTVKQFGCCFTPYGTLVSVDPTQGQIPNPFPSKTNLHA